MEKELEKTKIKLLDGLEKLRSDDGYIYAGSPRFMELFGRDSLISSLQLLYLYPDFLKNSLGILSKYQGNKYDAETGEEPGKILHELSNSRTYLEEPHKESWVRLNEPLFLSIDSTPLFIISALMFIRRNYKTNLDSLKGAVKRSVTWILKKLENTDFVTYNTIEINGKLASMGWMDGSWDLYGKLSGDVALIEIQGYAYEALKLFNETFPDNNLYKKINDKIIHLKNNIDKYFWIDDVKYYSPAISIFNGEINILKNITSAPGHLLITDIIDIDRKRAIVDKLFDKNMLTPYGIRTVSTGDDIFNPLKYQSGCIWPNDNWIILEGLKKSGFIIEAEKLRLSLLKAATSLKEPYEYYSVDKNNNMICYNDLLIKPCELQAWTVGLFLSIMDNNFYEGSLL